MKILLIGYMGCGKSVVGKKLATSLGISFKDLDTEIEKSCEQSISQIFAEKGEIYFRKMELKILEALLNYPENFVMATGGGTPCYGMTMDLIKQNKDAISIYLKTPIDVLVARLLPEKEKRPLISHLTSAEDLTDFVRKHLFERGYFYNQAHIIVNSEETVEKTVAEILQKLV
jgi:shikimate kinase